MRRSDSRSVERVTHAQDALLGQLEDRLLHRNMDRLVGPAEQRNGRHRRRSRSAEPTRAISAKRGRTEQPLGLE